MIRKSRLYGLFIMLGVLVTVLCTQVSAYTYPKMPANWEQLQVKIGDVTLPLQEYQSGAYWDPEKCYMTTAEAAQYGISTRNDIYLRGWECVGFGRYVYAALFYKYPANATMDTNLGYDNVSSYAYKCMGTLSPGYSASELKALITSCQPGALMRINGHTMMVMAIYDDGVIIYDANFSFGNEINVRKYTWSEFVDSLSGRGIQAIHMPTYYPGYTYSLGGSSEDTNYDIDTSTAGSYRVVNCSALNVRAAPSTASSILGRLQAGTTVEILGSYSGWYAFYYNDQTGWLYGSYLEPNLEVKFDPNGGYMPVTSQFYAPGTPFGSFPVVSKDNRNLIGWSDGVTTYTAESIVPNTPGLTLTAVWGIHTYQDVPETVWYADTVERANRYGLISTDTLYNPNRATIRCEFVAVLCREYEREINQTVSGISGDHFSDVPANAWYNGYVNWAYQNGIVNGISETEFAPVTEITREQIVTILYRYAKYVGKLSSGYGGNALIYQFSDGDDVSDFAVEAMNWAIDVGILRGDDLGKLNPKMSAKRSEMATIAVRFIDYLG